MNIPPNLSTQETIDLTFKFCQEVIAAGVEGDFVECGVAGGNNLAAMCSAGRHGYGFDSFEGIPWAGKKDSQQPGMSSIPEIKQGISSGISSYDIENVHYDMKKWGIENYTLIKGWFKDTIPNQQHVRRISVLRLDGDLYDSTIIPLISLYPLLSKGGILIMDDWNLEGCSTAFLEYFSEIKEPDLILNNGVTYWKK